MAETVVLEPKAPVVSEDPEVLQWEELHLKEGERLEQSLGYSGFKKKALQKAGHNILARALRELGVPVFDSQAVWQYKCQKKKLPEPAPELRRKWFWYTSDLEVGWFFWTIVAGLIGGIFSGMTGASEDAVFVSVVSCCVAATASCISLAFWRVWAGKASKYGFKELQKRREEISGLRWRKFTLAEYAKRNGEIPLFALQLADRIKTTLSNAEFLVEELAMRESIDPFLIVQIADIPETETYIAVWNEPGFFQPPAA